jgi:hypothetical protein
MPALPHEAKQPSGCEARDRAKGCCLADYPDEPEEAARWIEPPNAAQDEYPLMRALAERGENATRNSQARRQVLAAAAIVRFWSALPLEKPNRQEISRSRLIGPSLPALGWTRFRRRDADRGAA